MDSYTLGIILRAVLERAGIWAVIGVVLAASIGMSVFMLGKYAILIIREWLSSRDAERAKLIDELRAERQQNNILLSNHMDHLNKKLQNESEFNARLTLSQEKITQFSSEQLDQLKRLGDALKHGFDECRAQHNDMWRDLKHE